jgi:PAS domain S-box-containing protein
MSALPVRLAPPYLAATLRYHGGSPRNSAKTVATLENHSAGPAGLLDKILTREGLLGRSWIRYSGAVALVGAALAVRSILLPANGGFAFITFYPAVIAVALIFGVGPGVLASVLSAVCAAFLFLSPFRSQTGQAASFGFFLLTCGLTTFVAHRLRKSVVRLRASELKFRTLYEASNVGIVLTDVDRRYVEFNETFRRLTGYSADELRELEYRTLTDPKDWVETDAQFELAARTGQFGPYEKEYVRKDGSRIPLRFNGAMFTADDGRKYLWSIVDDISERRHLERALLNSASAEQQKLGRDLHDGLGQELAGISLLASAIASSIRKAGRPEAAELENLASLSAQAVANCRALAHGLSPVTFANGGLREALMEMVGLLRDSFGLDARCEVLEAVPIRLLPDALDNLYRISQEAVSNARRHGRAQSVKITLESEAAVVRLTIEDDGSGIPQSPPATGMGLKIMQFRAATMGARLSIGPRESGGTRVSVECVQAQ